jgi:hypothetical protein
MGLFSILLYRVAYDFQSSEASIFQSQLNQQYLSIGPVVRILSATCSLYFPLSPFFHGVIQVSLSISPLIMALVLNTLFAFEFVPYEWYLNKFRQRQQSNMDVIHFGALGETTICAIL